MIYGCPVCDGAGCPACGGSEDPLIGRRYVSLWYCERDEDGYWKEPKLIEAAAIHYSPAAWVSAENALKRNTAANFALVIIPHATRDDKVLVVNIRGDYVVDHPWRGYEKMVMDTPYQGRERV